MLGAITGLYTTWSHLDFWWPQFFPALHGHFHGKIYWLAHPQYSSICYQAYICCAEGYCSDIIPICVAVS